MPNITEASLNVGKSSGKRGPGQNGWLEYGRDIDNLRAALDWAFSPEANAATGIALTVAAVPLWMHLSLLEECRDRVEQALAALTALAEPNPRQEMKLLAALGAFNSIPRRRPRGGLGLDKGPGACRSRTARSPAPFRDPYPRETWCRRTARSLGSTGAPRPRLRPCP